MATECKHFDGLKPVAPRTPDGCEECLKMGGRWVHLRLCLECGHVGCCDNSPNRHATKHFKATGDTLIASFEPGERWAYCYAEDEMYDVPESAEAFLR